jgi:exopolyphosphatase / guanosine-5'-triphosphate,3'-diphosphate pyrophosphatase
MSTPQPAGPRALPAEAGERIAAIDVGSNSIRLVVAEYDPSAGLTIIDEVKEQPRLAAGLATTGRLDEAAIERAYASLRRMREVCQRRGVRRLNAVATAAVREAENGEDFTNLIREELEIPLRIIDGDQEASLSYRSVAHHFRLEGGRTIVADIGGGSLELIGSVDGLVEYSTSLPFGAVRSTEMHLPGKREPRKEIASLRGQVRKRLKRVFPGKEWIGAGVIGSGGTFTNLGRMVAARRGVNPASPVHGLTIRVGEVEQLLAWLGPMSAEQRIRVPGLNPQRADIIVAGIAVTASLLDWIEARELTISAYGLREGLLLDMVGAEVVPIAVDPLRLIREFVERCHGDRRHVEHVRLLALQLFDQLADTLEPAPGERGLLEAASLLHDVGQMVSYRRHHLHSFQLIMHADRLNLDPHQRLLVAMISRYHRRRGPRKKHEEFAALEPADQELVRRLSGILRVADGLDRGHTATVESVQVEQTRSRLIVTAIPRLAGADLSLESHSASELSDVLAKYLGKEVVVRTA